VTKFSTKAGVMNQDKFIDGTKSQVYSSVWNIRRKLAAGFSALILITVVSGIAIWSQLQSVSEIADALSSLNPMAKNTQYLAHDVNAYLLGHEEHRDEFDQHSQDFNNEWQNFVAHQEKHEGAPEDEQAIMDQIRALSEVYFENSEGLFDTYDKQKLSQQQLSQIVVQTLEALNVLVVAHQQQYSDQEVTSATVADGSSKAGSDSEIFHRPWFDLKDLITVIQSFLLGTNKNIGLINQRVDVFQSSVELLITRITDESDGANKFTSQVEIIRSNYLQIVERVLGLIKLSGELDNRWQQVDVTGDNLDDRVSELVRVHNQEIESTRIESTRFALFVIITAVLVGLGAAIFIGNLITVPINELISAVRGFGEGQLDRRVNVSSGDEIGKLGKTFNQMATDINEYRTEIENVQGDLLRSERLAALGTLIATVSHEIRNPLGTIRAAVYSIGKQLDGQNFGIQKTLDRAERSIERCDNIIEELLDYTRTPTLETKSTVIDEWIKKVLDDQNFDPLINLSYQLNAPATAQLDQLRFQGCLLNTINNACQAMIESEEDGQTYNLSVITAINGDNIVIKVKDSGPGIRPENIEKVFEPMFSTRAFGVGLGLSIVEKVIQQHNGRVEIDSQLGEGTTVSLWLPVDTSEEN
jgi:signal transduction histidine kinase